MHQRSTHLQEQRIATPDQPVNTHTLRVLGAARRQKKRRAPERKGVNTHEKIQQNKSVFILTCRSRRPLPLWRTHAEPRLGIPGGAPSRSRRAFLPYPPRTAGPTAWPSRYPNRKKIWVRRGLRLLLWYVSCACYQCIVGCSERFQRRRASVDSSSGRVLSSAKLAAQKKDRIEHVGQ